MPQESKVPVVRLADRENSVVEVASGMPADVAVLCQDVTGAISDGLPTAFR